MKRLFAHVQDYIVRGLIAIIPLALCALAIRLLYVLIDKRIMVFLGNFFAVRQIPGLGLLLLLAFLYLIGLIFSNILGRQLLWVIEKISKKIPIINTIYGVGKQVTQGFSAEGENQAFKKAVLIRLRHEECWIPGFLMNQVRNSKTQEDMLMVYVPTVPTPTGGFIFLVKAEQVIDPGWNAEESLKVILSMGIVLPKNFNP